MKEGEKVGAGEELDMVLKVSVRDLNLMQTANTELATLSLGHAGLGNVHGGKDPKSFWLRRMS